MKAHLIFLLSIYAITQSSLLFATDCTVRSQLTSTYAHLSSIAFQAGSHQPGDHPPTLDERGTDYAVGGGHNLSAIFIIVAFIFSILSLSHVFDRRSMMPFQYGLPGGLILIGGAIAVLTIFLILSAGGGAADHPATGDERAGDYFFGCYSHHALELWLCFIAALFSLISLLLMIFKVNWGWFAITIFIAAVLEFAVAIVLLA
jgi:hypothetical protein